MADAAKVPVAPPLRPLPGVACPRCHREQLGFRGGVVKCSAQFTMVRPSGMVPDSRIGLSEQFARSSSTSTEQDGMEQLTEPCGWSQPTVEFLRDAGL